VTLANADEITTKASPRMTCRRYGV